MVEIRHTEDSINKANGRHLLTFVTNYSSERGAYMKLGRQHTNCSSSDLQYFPLPVRNLTSSSDQKFRFLPQARMFC